MPDQPITKTDYKKTFKHLYNPSGKQFTTVDVPPVQFLMADGAGDPNTAQEYADVVAALYGVAYGLKNFSKQQHAQDFTVMPLEGLWWAEDMAQFTALDKANWLWTMMIMQPEHITAAMLDEAKATLLKKKKGDVPLLERVRLATYHEGLSAHILYVGAYADEAPTIAALHEYITAGGHTLRGKHHEIYLGDPRKVPPEKLKTIIRQPMAAG